MSDWNLVKVDMTGVIKGLTDFYRYTVKDPEKFFQSKESDWGLKENFTFISSQTIQMDWDRLTMFTPELLEFSEEYGLDNTDISFVMLNTSRYFQRDLQLGQYHTHDSFVLLMPILGCTENYITRIIDVDSPENLKPVNGNPRFEIYEGEEINPRDYTLLDTPVIHDAKNAHAVFVKNPTEREIRISCAWHINKGHDAIERLC